MGLILRTIVIPDYPDRIAISKARRPIYYIHMSSEKKGVKVIPKRYSNKKKYFFDKKGVLVNRETGRPQLANPRTAGEPRFWTVNFQEIWNGVLAGPARASKVNMLKDILRPFIAAVLPIEEEHYPLRLEFFLFNSEFNVDASNKGVIYVKIIEDLLVSEGKIVDDSARYINDTARIKYIVTPAGEQRKMIVKIITSDNYYPYAGNNRDLAY